MATVSPLRQQFGAKLRTLILNSPHRQCELAKALQISNSAVSQMLVGKIIPRHTQLKVFCELLSLSRDEELELSSLLLTSGLLSSLKTLKTEMEKLDEYMEKRKYDPRILTDLFECEEDDTEEQEDESA